MRQMALGFIRDRDYPAPPATYGDCEGRRHLRALPASDARAERCQALGCRYNLLRPLAKMPEKKAIAALEKRYERELWHTCALDAAEDKLTDSQICVLLGSRPQNLTPEIAEIIQSTRLDWILREAMKPEI